MRDSFFMGAGRKKGKLRVLRGYPQSFFICRTYPCICCLYPFGAHDTPSGHTSTPSGTQYPFGAHSTPSGTQYPFGAHSTPSGTQYPFGYTIPLRGTQYPFGHTIPLLVPLLLRLFVRKKKRPRSAAPQSVIANVFSSQKLTREIYVIPRVSLKRIPLSSILQSDRKQHNCFSP